MVYRSNRPWNHCRGRSCSTEITCHFKRTHGHNSRVTRDIQYPECTPSSFREPYQGAGIFWTKPWYIASEHPKLG
jgi:hypothetical protein